MFATVLKFNSHHDPKDGKFTTADGAKVSGAARSKLHSMFDRIGQPDGGFTYQPMTGSEPSAGYALSIYPEKSFAKPADQLKFKDLVDYYLKNRDVFSQPDHFIGAWHDPASHNVFLDVSVVKDSEEEATKLALAHDQIAYFDLKNFKSITVNPDAKSGVLKGNHGQTETGAGKADRCEDIGDTGATLPATDRAGADAGRIGGSGAVDQRSPLAKQGLWQSIAKVLKFNKYHDDQGRFTTKDGAVQPGHKAVPTVNAMAQALDKVGPDQFERMVTAHMQQVHGDKLSPNDYAHEIERVARQILGRQSIARVLKFNKWHDPHTGEFTFADHAAFKDALKAMGHNPDQHPNILQASVAGKKIFANGESLGIPRGNMPQIPAEDYPEFFKSLGVAVTRHDVDPNTLKPTQSEIDGFKTAKLYQQIKHGSHNKTILASKEGYILDGHHHWAAHVVRSMTHPDDKISVDVIDMDTKSLLERAHEFDKAHGIESKDITKHDFAAILKEDPYHDPKNGQFTTAAGAGHSGSSVSGNGGIALRPQQPDALPPQSVTHYGKQAGVTELSGAYYGTGIRGAEAERLAKSKDFNIKNRVYFYLNPPDGKLPRKEAGLGNNVYQTTLSNLYDLANDPKGIFDKIKGIDDPATKYNTMESEIVKAGYDGYISKAYNMAVVLGKNVPVREIKQAAEIDYAGMLRRRKKRQPGKAGFQQGQMDLNSVNASMAAANGTGS